MKARDWQVGLLSELHPKRDPTLLGLNKNAGEAVYLRILTDELDGLRSVSAGSCHVRNTSRFTELTRRTLSFGSTPTRAWCCCTSSRTTSTEIMTSSVSSERCLGRPSLQS